ncbi:hypothetical protein [Nitrobacter sp. JJSN]|jgi:hypothetical protein|uniref:hypothetical protein n=1 Tax=Nitrobacter sp. JJSN TaxID=3453033 RepID=UPI003F75D2FC
MRAPAEQIIGSRVWPPKRFFRMGFFRFAPQSLAGSDVMGRNNQEPRDLHVRVCRTNSRLTKIRNGLLM